MKTEISNTNLYSEGSSIHLDISYITQQLLSALSKNSAVYKIFKSQVQCTKRFRDLVDQENYSVCFQYLSKFVIELLDSFEICEDYYSHNSTEIIEDESGRGKKIKNQFRDEEKKKTLNRMTEDLKNSSEKQSIRIEKLNEEVMKISKTEKLAKSENFDTNPEFQLNRSRLHKRQNFPYENSPLKLENLNTDHESGLNDIRDYSLSNKRSNRNASKSKSPKGARQPINKYQEYSTPILRKTDCWKSVADFFSETKPK